MKSVAICCLSLVSLGLVVVTSAQTAKSGVLTGDYWVGGKTTIDPPRDEPNDTHLRIHLTGDSARTLYELMNSEPEVDVCDESRLVKRIATTACALLEGGSHECWLAIDVQRQELTSGWGC